MKLPPLPRIEVFKGKQFHYVRLTARNGEKMNLTEGYSNRSNAMRAAKRLQAIAAAATIVVLSGCANLTPEQIAAMSGQSGALCVTGATWNGSPMSVQYTSFGGKSVGTAGGGGVAECGAAKFTFTNEGKIVPGQPPKVSP